MLSCFGLLICLSVVSSQVTDTTVTGGARSRGSCSQGQVSCQNGQCINREYLCDGDFDCTDRSDEANCGATLPCEPNEFQCTNGKCAVKTWRCDGDNDCGDSSDEQNCPVAPPGSACKLSEYRCLNRNQCIPSSYQCDGEIDCQDRSDEIGCSAPTVSQAPPPMVMGALGSTITISCRAVGNPIPLISWRLNWGHVPRPPRVSSTSANGYGVLTIRNLQESDQGAYSCEALNTKGSIFAQPDAIVVVKAPVGLCSSPFFNANAKVRAQCIRCFCFGITNQCSSSSLYLSQIGMGGSINIVRKSRPQVALDSSYVQSIPRYREFAIRDFTRRLPGGSVYWSLPSHFFRNKLTSYGGKLEYRIKFSGGGQRPRLTRDDTVILRGNGITLYHRRSKAPKPNIYDFVKVSIIESSFEKPGAPGRGDISASRTSASREDLMMVLQNLTSIEILASHADFQTGSWIKDIALGNAITTDTGRGRAFLVEQCNCPTGYTGHSCEDCAPGYRRTRSGRYLGTCQSCNCNGHSNVCDPITGQCTNCQHNTRGPRCDQCADGFYGNAKIGRPTDCQPCPCPLTIPSNQFGRTCYLASDGGVTCNCPSCYSGRRCERCDTSNNCVGNPNIPGGRCARTVEVCDARGSSSRLPNPNTRQCICKDNVEGRLCDRCKQNTFGLSNVNQYGCISCFCMGVPGSSCRSSNLYWGQISASFSRDPQDVVLTTSTGEKQDVVLSVNSRDRFLSFNDFNKLSRRTYYWSLPPPFLGNKLKSYGGYLNFTIQFSDRGGGPNNDPDVELVGKKTNMWYRHSNVMVDDKIQTFQVPLLEQYWQSPNGRSMTREQFLMALASLDAIRIKAKYTPFTTASKIRDISLDFAGVNGRRRAESIEMCQCPAGYEGLSCEKCSTGYSRIEQGLYLGLCRRCQCNGHSTRCNPTTGACENCQHNTAGDRCQFCLPGYYGDATIGTPNDCRRCACPLTVSSNNFSPTCSIRNGELVCNNCPAGYTGTQCQRCATGYVGNPLQVGSTCTRRPEERIIVTIQPPRQTTTIGSTVQFRCTANSQGASYTIAWTKQGGVLPEQATDRNGVLTIPNVQRRDAGQYMCTGSTRRSIDTEIATMIVNVPPQIDVPPRIRIEPRFLRVVEGNRVEFRCIVEAGSPTPTLTWSGGQSKQHSFQNGVFTIATVTKGDEAEYYCMARNSAGQTRVRTILYVTEAEIVPGVVDISRPSINVTINQDVRVVCRPKTGFVARRITWERERDSLPTVATVKNGVLYIPNFQPQHSGRYICTILSDGGKKGIGEARIRIKVSVRPTVVIIGSTTRTPDVGSSVLLQCDISGNPTPRITWTRLSQPLPSNAVASGNVLRIRNIQRGDAGIYVCRAQNSAGITDGRFTINVRDLRRPQIQILPSRSLTLALNARGFFTCRAASGNPRPTIRWRRLDRSSFGPNTVVQGERLLFNRVSNVDVGSYECIATNAAGSISESVTLSLKRDIKVQINGGASGPIRAIEGAKISLQCTAVGNPTPNVYWLSPTRTRILPSGITRFSSTGGLGSATLMIESVALNDQGTYSCVAEGVGGVRQTGQIQIIVIKRQTGPVINPFPKEQTAPVDATVTLECIASGNPPISYRWVREGKAMPRNVDINNGVLVIRRIQLRDAGQYTCIATNRDGQARVSVNIIVRGPVGVNIQPQLQEARAGQRVIFTCRSSDSGARFTWRKVGGALSTNAIDRNGVLTILSAKPTDAGRYMCLAYSSGSALPSRGYASLTITSRPSVKVHPSRGIYEYDSGSTVSLQCYFGGSTPLNIKWTKEGGVLPVNHRVINGILTIYNVRPSDAGRYKCSANNQYGSAIDFVNLFIRYVSIQGQRSRTIRSRVGATVTMTCSAQGYPAPTVRWTRSGKAMPSNSRLSGTGLERTLEISNIQIEDSGAYQCVVQNTYGRNDITVQMIVEGRTVPIDEEIRNIQTASVGRSAVIKCFAEGTPPLKIEWTKLKGELPRNSKKEQGALTIPQVKKSDNGTYICKVEDSLGRVDSKPYNLLVGDWVPYFKEQKTAFVSYPRITDAYLKFEIELSFKPEAANGLILYNGEVQDGGGDFIVFGLREGKAEFRFDLGSGPAIIKSRANLDLNEWHTVKLDRNKKQGSLTVYKKSGQQSVTSGNAPGQYTGLDLKTPLYVGGVPDYDDLATASGFDKGFIGAISKIHIQRLPLDLGEDAIEVRGIDDYPVCKGTPCQNKGICQPSSTNVGYKCICPRGTSGRVCEIARLIV